MQDFKMKKAYAMFALLTLTACREGDMPITENTAAKSSTNMAQTWERLGTKRVFFGHQSVGGEVIDGVKMLAAESGIDLNIVRSKDPASVTGPAFVEHPIGENGDPASKTADFAAIVRNGFGEQGGIAFFKYCFLDIDVNTDVEVMFEEYRRTMAEITKAYPKLQIVHVTIPLTTIEGAPVALAKQILKGTSRRAVDEPPARHPSSTWPRSSRPGPMARARASSAVAPRCTRSRRSGRMTAAT
jgi:hypothetical protein